VERSFNGRWRSRNLSDDHAEAAAAAALFVYDED